MGDQRLAIGGSRERPVVDGFTAYIGQCAWLGQRHCNTDKVDVTWGIIMRARQGRELRKGSRQRLWLTCARAACRGLSSASSNLWVLVQPRAC